MSSVQYNIPLVKNYKGKVSLLQSIGFHIINIQVEISIMSIHSLPFLTQNKALGVHKNVN